MADRRKEWGIAVLATRNNLVKNQAQGSMLIITDRSQFFPWCQKLWSALFKYNSFLFLTGHDLLSVYLSGFLKKHSTETAVVYLTDYILGYMDRQMITGAVFIDLRKCFRLGRP